MISDTAWPLPPSAVAAAGKIFCHDRRDLATHGPRLEAYVERRGPLGLSRHPAWLAVLQRGLRQIPYCLEAVCGERTQGVLALAYVRSLLFGRFLVSLPYLNHGGVLADDEPTARLLIDRAVQLADELHVRYLELRHDVAIEHPALRHRFMGKVHMRLALPATADQLWQGLRSKVRSQVRKGQQAGLKVAWGGEELLPEFYAVFSRNMRHLGMPVFGRRLFSSMVRQFPGQAELCVVRAGRLPLAAALLLHGRQISEVPSAGSVRPYNHTCANMLMYWCLLERSIQRRQAWFDFGRSTLGSATYRFKKQWGALPEPAEWQYYLRAGTLRDLRPDNPPYHRAIRLWQYLPIRLTQMLGPWIVRGIP